MKFRGELLALIVIGSAAAHADDMMSKPNPNSKSPSTEQVLWTETDVGADVEGEYSYVPGGRVDFGNGRRGSVDENYFDIKAYTSTRALMAFLFHTGFEVERMSFQPDNNTMVPNELDDLKAYIATDFRWSEHDMVRFQLQPGFYTDMHSVANDFNVPMALAYTRIQSKKFQAAIGLSIDTWRQDRYLVGGGFRYYINDDWALKFMLPTPVVEYKAMDTLHLTAGADLRGGTYRVAKNFGDVRGDSQTNNAIVEYNEIRVGMGWSWNIRPLIELDGSVGYIPDRTYIYPHTAFQSKTTGAPYISLSFKVLFQLVKDERTIPEQIKALQYEFPQLRKFFK